MIVEDSDFIFSGLVEYYIRGAESNCKKSHCEIITPEHLLETIISDDIFIETCRPYHVDLQGMMKDLKSYTDGLDMLDEEPENVESSFQLTQLFKNAALMANSAGRGFECRIPLQIIIISLWNLPESWASFYLKKYILEFSEFGNFEPFMKALMKRCKASHENFVQPLDPTIDVSNIQPLIHFGNTDDDSVNYESFDDSDQDFDDIDPNAEVEIGNKDGVIRIPFIPGAFGNFQPLPNDAEDDADDDSWKKYVTHINPLVEGHNPLIGRDKELDRTVQILCRKDKNNPLHVGEPGVGKTALVYGLADRINKGEVPDRLKNSQIYSLEMASLVAGTQFRGDMEKRIKKIMSGAARETNVIIYIDEIHTLVGAGTTSDSALDASNMLKPYLEAGTIRFIGSTTYEEYNRFFAKSKSIVRRFQQSDINEPSIDETIAIIKGLQKNYEKYHHVVYRPEAIEFAVRASAKYINDRFLPDKAIDLVDEAGAYLEIHPNDKSTQYVTKDLIAKVLQRTCKIDASVMKEDDNRQLKTLYKRMAERIYGQDEAISQVVEAVEMAKAGLQDDNKPLASLLFVGPTGVGKTEVARVLAQQLGIELVRFDMSEYMEKHAVAKLIGSPAGYVGYEDGGLLVDAIRKTPNCVLLLDEIEKAHSDIFNILLQVMDYAKLTDNKGQKADFRHVVVIMTSNAGAQFASQASVGFQSAVSRGDAMLATVKKTFKPEFINRLSGIVVFHDMDEKMASLILQKKVSELEAKLQNKHVTLTLTDEAIAELVKRGFTQEYGAREMDRVIARELKPLLMKEILYGKLRKGGHVDVEYQDGKFILK